MIHENRMRLYYKGLVLDPYKTFAAQGVSGRMEQLTAVLLPPEDDAGFLIIPHTNARTPAPIPTSPYSAHSDRVWVR